VTVIQKSDSKELVDMSYAIWFLILLHLMFVCFFTHNCRYVLYWLVIFACKFTFAYFLQASYHVLISHLLIMHMITIWGFALKQGRLYTSEYHFHVIFNPEQIRPLVKPTNTIRALPSLPYSWHDLISKSEFPIIRTFMNSVFYHGV
jgi:hypothetical protein